MKNRTVVYQAPAPANHASEIEYADFMHFSAAYLPSGSSPSLDIEPEPAAAPVKSSSTPATTRRLVIEHTPILFAA